MLDPCSPLKIGDAAVYSRAPRGAVVGRAFRLLLLFCLFAKLEGEKQDGSANKTSPAPRLQLHRAAWESPMCRVCMARWDWRPCSGTAVLQLLGLVLVAQMDADLGVRGENSERLELRGGPY